MKLLRIAGWIISALSITFIAYKVFQFHVDFSLFLSPRVALSLTIGLVAQLIALFILTQAYHHILVLFGNPPKSKIDYMTVYARTNLAKYLPGNVMHIVSRNLAAEEVGAPQKALLVASILEIALILLACFLLILLLHPDLGTLMPSPTSTRHIIGAIVVVGGLMLFGLLRVKTIKQQLRSRSNLKFIWNILAVTGYYILVLLFQMLIPVIVAYSIQEVAMDRMVLRDIANAYLLSWTAGFLTIGAPGGIGVREVVFCSLVPAMPMKSLLLISVAQRLVSIISDVVFFLATLLIAGVRTYRT